MTENLDYYRTVVIGSGFGGAVAATTLVESGEQVLLLERGPWRDSESVRDAGIQRRASLPVGRKAINHLVHRVSFPGLMGKGKRLSTRGLFDIHFGNEMSVVCSSGVGGGSHVYSAMNMRPHDPDYWDNKAEGVSSKAMETHYAWMLECMEAKVPNAEAKIPNWTPEAYEDSKEFVADADVPQPAMSVRMDGQQEDYCNNSYFGSANGAKATLDRVLILPAMKKGLQVEPEQECLSLWALPEGGYRLEIMDYRLKRRRYLKAGKVIVAAGTLNTLRLLFHSREIGGLRGMPALGQGFSGNGDSVAWWALNEKGADFSLGTPTHGRFALRDPDTGKAVPGPYITRFGLNGVNTLPLPEPLKARLRRDAIIVGMGKDNANGVALWKRGRLKFRYIMESNGILSDIQELFSEIARRSRKPVRFLKHKPFTVHPLGGARLAPNEEEGVVGSTGEVYGLPGLYIADASALPASPGTPPSMTVAAWARHLALGIAGKKKRGTPRSKQIKD